MTFEELKEEAAKHGYRLVPARAFEPLLPCTCGCNRRSTWKADGIGKVFLSCKVCNLSASGKNMTDARRAWNAMIRELTED